MDHEKNVDESWKEQAEQEKLTEEGGAEALEQAAENFELNFLNYITSLGFQALVFLGEIPSPVSNQSEKNLLQARLIIDTLAMLREKTKGNLTEQETHFLDSSLYELQMKFVELLKQENSSQGLGDA